MVSGLKVDLDLGTGLNWQTTIYPEENQSREIYKHVIPCASTIRFANIYRACL